MAIPLSVERRQTISDVLTTLNAKSPVSREDLAAAKERASKEGLLDQIWAWFNPTHREKLNQKRKEIDKIIDQFMNLKEGFNQKVDELKISNQEKLFQSKKAAFIEKMGKAELNNLNTTQKEFEETAQEQLIQEMGQDEWSVLSPEDQEEKVSDKVLANKNRLIQQLGAEAWGKLSLEDQKTHEEKFISEIISGQYASLIGQIIDDFITPALSIDDINMCFGFNREKNMVVLRLIDGERSHEIDVCPINTQDEKKLEAIPSYWFGSSPEQGLFPALAEMKKKGAFENNIRSCIKDAERIGVNNRNLQKTTEEISKASDVKPGGLTLPDDLKGDEIKKVNFFVAELKQIHPQITNDQVETFLKLCSQNAVPLKGSFGYKADTIGVTLSDAVKVKISVTKWGELQLTIKVDMDINRSTDSNRKILGRFSWETSFTIDEDGLVPAMTCKASSPAVSDFSQLTASELFAIEELARNNRTIAAAFVEDAFHGELEGIRSKNRIAEYIETQYDTTLAMLKLESDLSRSYLLNMGIY